MLMFALLNLNLILFTSSLASQTLGGLRMEGGEEWEVAIAECGTAARWQGVEEDKKKMESRALVNIHEARNQEKASFAQRR